MPKTETRLWTCEGVPLLSLTTTLPFGLHPEIDALLSLVKAGALDACEKLFPMVQEVFKQNPDPRRNFTTRRAEVSLLCHTKQIADYLSIELTTTYRFTDKKQARTYYTLRLCDGKVLPLFFFLSRRQFYAYQKEKRFPKGLSYHKAKCLPFRLSGEGLALLYKGNWYTFSPA